MAFLPDMTKWVKIHYEDSINEVVGQIGDPTGKRVLDLGCGEMLMTFGLAAKGAAEVVGIDIAPLDPEGAVEKIVGAGFGEVEALRDRVIAVTYDGERMPFPDEHFDVVFSWGVMEHVNDVPAVLSEIKRVLKPGGVAFIKVFPWFHCYYGSHLSDFLDKPFAHLTTSDAEMRGMIERAAHVQTILDPNLILGHMWEEYLTLNRYSANMFYRDVRKAGFSRNYWRILSDPRDLSEAPDDHDLSDLLITGTDTILHK